MYDLLFWGIVFIVMIIVESFSTQLVSIWFAAGSALAFIVAIFTDSATIQSTVFIVASVILLIFTRPIVKKLVHKPPVPTNADAIIGKEGIVIDEIDNIRNTGRAKIDGLSWLAKSVDNQHIPTGSVVEVVSIEGVCAHVKLK